MITIQEVKSSPFGQIVTLTGLVKAVEEKQTPKSTFLCLTLSDKTGCMDVRIFDNKANYSEAKALRTSTFVTVTGTVGRFKESFSFELINFASVGAHLVNVSDFVAVAPEGEAYLRSEFLRLMSTRPPELQAWVAQIMHDNPEFFTAPAAFSMHHAYRHGLLEHSVHVAKIVERLLLAAGAGVNADVAIVGALLHDIGKAKEYTGLSPTHTDIGRLFGHIGLGLMIVSAYPENIWKTDILHIIASHHGKIEHGAIVIPSTPAAIVVSMADNEQAKLGMMQQALRETTGMWAEYHKGLETRLKVR